MRMAASSAGCRDTSNVVDALELTARQRRHLALLRRTRVLAVLTTDDATETARMVTHRCKKRRECFTRGGDHARGVTPRCVQGDGNNKNFMILCFLVCSSQK